VDLTAEWYVNRNALVGASLFYKNLKSLVRDVAVVQSFPITIINTNGTTTPSSSDFTVNALQPTVPGVRLKGVEVYAQSTFDFLPKPFDGLGAQANYTYINNSDPNTLTAASKNNFNVSVFL